MFSIFLVLKGLDNHSTKKKNNLNLKFNHFLTLLFYAPNERVTIPTYLPTAIS